MKDNSVFDDYSKFYDLLYADKDYQGESQYIDELLRAFDMVGPELLELGSGTGKHGNLLAALGYNVHGIERSGEMVAKAKVGNGFTIEQGDVCDLRLNRKFGAIISLFHVISYQTSNESIVQLFNRAGEHLNVGGLFIFDVWYSPAVYEQKPLVRVKRAANDEVELTRIAEPTIVCAENRVDVEYTVFARNLKTDEVQTFTERHPMRHFSKPEIDLLASMSGFAVAGAQEFLTGREPSEKTWGVCFILRKVN